MNFVGVLLTASAFPLARYFRRFTSRIKQRWRALSAGVAVAYVFVLIMPELVEHGQVIANSAAGKLFNPDKHVYLWALAGFVFFAGMRRLQIRTGADARPTDHTDVVFCGEVAGYASYTLLIGYLLTHREDATILSLGLFVFAMLLHLFLVDTELHEKFQRRYEVWGRTLLASGLFVGWVLGTLDAFPHSFTSRMFAFVVGGVVITAANEEWPAEEGGRFWWFVGGTTFYSALLMLI
jgi:hypothetical protein